VHLAAACRIAGEFLRGSRDGDSVGRIKGADAEWRAGSALAIKTMAGDNQS
jgi:hypothetical protein